MTTTLAAMHDLGVSDNESERDLATELAIYHAELEAQHAELMEANLRISEHVQELTALFDEAPVAYFVLDNGIVVRRWNGAATPLSTHGILTPGVFFTRLFISSDHITLREWLLNPQISEPLMVVAAHNPDLFCQLDKRKLSRGEVLVSVTDVTAQRQSELDAQVQRAQAFAYLAHELRTPAATIAMTMEANPTLSATPDGRVIKTSIDHVLSVMEDLRSVLSPDTDTHVLRAPVELKSLCHSLVDANRLQLENRGIQCHLDTAELTPGELWLTLNERSVRQIVTNLMKNVAVHSQASHAWVKVRGQREGAVTVINIMVSDDGIGIAPEDRERIFHPFQQGIHNSGGMGIGLDVSRKLANLMNGSLRLSKREGGGSCFTLSFPAVPVGQEAARVDENQPSKQLDGLTVLLVEDDANLRRLSLTLLNKAGATVEVAGDGVEGLEALEGKTFDLIIVDYMMPRMNGVSFIENARKRGQSGTIIGCTAATLGDDSARMVDAGANAVIGKPLNLHELTAQLPPH